MDMRYLKYKKVKNIVKIAYAYRNKGSMSSSVGQTKN